MREELAKQAWLVLLRDHPAADAAMLAYDRADAFIARVKAERIVDGVRHCVNLENLSAYWGSPEVQDVLRGIKARDPELYRHVESAKDRRKEQVMDNHQVEHAKGQAA